MSMNDYRQMRLRRRWMKTWHVILVLIAAVSVLAGCGGETPAPAAEQEAVVVNVNTDESGAYVSAVLDTSYEGALPASNQLALGTLQLEETENAVTPEQAKALLPLWQALQGGALQSNTEINSVIKQIEGKMTSEQLAAIAAMQLTAEDLGAWAQEQGMVMDFSPGAAATRQAERGGEGGPGQFGNLSEEEREAIRATMEAGGMPFGGDRGNLSEEEREAMRATMEAGGMPFGGGQGNLSEEEREAMRATAEAGGMNFGGRGFRGGAGQISFLAQPLIDLLTQRAAE
jgi:hypothetical protein